MCAVCGEYAAKEEYRILIWRRWSRIAGIAGEQIHFFPNTVLCYASVYKQWFIQRHKQFFGSPKPLKSG